jgi:hypothetical protein
MAVCFPHVFLRLPQRGSSFPSVLVGYLSLVDCWHKHGSERDDQSSFLANRVKLLDRCKIDGQSAEELVGCHLLSVVSMLLGWFLPYSAWLWLRAVHSLVCMPWSCFVVEAARDGTIGSHAPILDSVFF